jgi:hypothetical protein
VLLSCGTTGRISFYDYKVSKDSLQITINGFLTRNEEYKFPIQDSSWKAYTPPDSSIYHELVGKQLVYKYKNLKKAEVYIYFKNKPEEVYWLSYYMNEKYWSEHPNNSRLAIVAVVKKGGKWRYSDAVFNRFFKGRKRVEQRLEQEVLNKLPFKYEKRR